MQLAKQRTLTLPRQLGTLLLAGWLIAAGVIPLLQLGSPMVSAVLHLTAIAAGVTLLWERRHG